MVISLTLVGGEVHSGQPTCVGRQQPLFYQCKSSKINQNNFNDCSQTVENRGIPKKDIT